MLERPDAVSLQHIYNDFIHLFTFMNYFIMASVAIDSEWFCRGNTGHEVGIRSENDMGMIFQKQNAPNTDRFS